MAEGTVKYHISPKTGNPNRCYATKQACPLGGDDDHFPDKETARKAYEKEMESGVPTASRKPQTPDRSLKSLSEEEVGEARYKWSRLVEVEKEISTLVDTIDKRYHNRGYLEKAKEHYKKAVEAEHRPVTEFTYGESNKRGVVGSHARAAIKEVWKTEVYKPNRSEPVYPDRDYPDLPTLAQKIEDQEESNEKALFLEERNLDYLYDEQDVYGEEVLRVTGFKEDPRYGVPSGETTKEKWAGKQAGNYSTLPKRDVEVLKETERLCTNCSEQVTYVESSYSWVHSNGEKKCSGSDSLTASANPVCRYCGTGDPSHYSFEQKSYSDESHCSRCGGTSGYGIGD